VSVYSVDKLIEEARRIAREYREATGKTLPLTGEIAINDAIRLLNLDPASDDAVGYDALMTYKGQTIKNQIKGRVVFNEKRGGYRLGQLKIEQEWDSILLVVMNANFETEEIYMAIRDDIKEAINESNSRKGSISLARFKIIGELLWTVENGIEASWSNTD